MMLCYEIFDVILHLFDGKGNKKFNERAKKIDYYRVFDFF
jgi:hypothetical protein